MNTKTYLMLGLAATLSTAHATITSAIGIDPGDSYYQDFNGLVAKGSRFFGKHTGNNLPDGWALSQPGRFDRYRLDDGRHFASGYYSYGAVGSSDRALGSLNHWWSAPQETAFGVAFLNAADSPMVGLQIEYQGEEWRLGFCRLPDRLDFQYSLDATSLKDGTWVDVNELDFVSPNLRGIGARNGNAAANQETLSGTVPLNVAAGHSFWLRWVDSSEAWLGSGLAVDDFTLRPLWEEDILPVPEAGTVWAGLGLAGLACYGWRRRNLRPA